MHDQITIQTERLLITSFSEEHLSDRYVAWLNDPIVVRYSEQRHRHHTQEQCRKYWEMMHTEGHILLAILLKQTPLLHIGNLSAAIDHPNQTADLAIMLGERELWGQGYGSEAWSATVDELLLNQGLRKITAGTMSKNKAMLNLMKRADMAQEGCRIGQFLLDGDIVDQIDMARFAEDGAISK